jgi:hypothetical protein
MPLTLTLTEYATPARPKRELATRQLRCQVLLFTRHRTLGAPVR